MKVRDFAKIFFAILFLHLAVIYKPHSEVLYIISKPLLVFSLLAFFVHKTAFFDLRGKSWVPAALLASLAGDILLIRESETLFLAGMGAFFLSHLFFIFFYLNQKIKTPWTMLVPALVVVAGSFYALIAIIDTPQELEPYLYGYAGILSLHLLAAVRVMSSGLTHAKWAALGILLFIASDLILAYDRFNVGGDKYWHLAVMLTYGFAQYLITIGLTHFVKGEGEAIERPSE